MKYPQGYQATFCEKTDTYRFSLGKKGKKNLMIIGFNPSTADLENSDPTMNNVIEFCKFNGYDGYIMTNANPYINSHQDKVETNKEQIIDNLKHIKEKIEELKISDILLAYGSKNISTITLKTLIEILEFIRNKKIYCIDKNSDNAPTHPASRVLNKKEIKPRKLIEFDIEDEIERLKRKLQN